jgi:general stress protein YciG
MAEKSKRGFASMSPEKQREIASKGGKAAHAKGKAHEFTSEEARAAGRKGGYAAHQRGRAHEFTSEEARQASRKRLQMAEAARATEAAPQGELTHAPGQNGPANGAQNGIQTFEGRHDEGVMQSQP